MRKAVISIFGLAVVIAVLLVLSLMIGSVDIPAGGIAAVLLGDDTVRTSWRFIVIESRLPAALTAMLSGASLAVSGLLLQTLFHNALAGPDVFGISSGASLAVAIVMLASGGAMAVGAFTLSGFMAVLMAAFIGAMAVTALILMFSSLVRNGVMLLIIGIMTGYLAGSGITLLNSMATEEGVKQYVTWGMGTFGNVTMDMMPPFATVTLAGLFLSLLMVKPMNAMLLGEQYAENLGVSIRKTRNIILLITGLLTAVATAFCGPVAFIGLATPHIARLLLGTDDHRRLLPVTMLAGSAIAMACNLLCFLPGEDGMLPLNAVTPIVCAPVMIYVIVKRGR